MTTGPSLSPAATKWYYSIAASVLAMRLGRATYPPMHQPMMTFGVPFQAIAETSQANEPSKTHHETATNCQKIEANDK